MASPGLKIELINGAYSQLRISGLTVIPGPEQISLALRRLENSVAELYEIWNISLPYNFEDDPDFNSPHNLPKGILDAIEVYLAYRLAGDFGKQISPALAVRLKGSMTALFKYSASSPRVSYPSRMPVGKRINTLFRDSNFFPNSVSVPISSLTISMFNGERRSFIESFLTEMNDTEVISIVSIEADSQLTVNSFVNTDYDVTVDITAIGNSDKSASAPQLKISATTDEDKTIIRIKDFELKVSEI